MPGCSLTARASPYSLTLPDKKNTLDVVTNIQGPGVAQKPHPGGHLDGVAMAYFHVGQDELHADVHQGGDAVKGLSVAALICQLLMEVLRAQEDLPVALMESWSRPHLIIHHPFSRYTLRQSLHVSTF